MMLVLVAQDAVMVVVVAVVVGGGVVVVLAGTQFAHYLSWHLALRLTAAWTLGVASGGSLLGHCPCTAVRLMTICIPATTSRGLLRIAIRVIPSRVSPPWLASTQAVFDKLCLDDCLRHYGADDHAS